MAGAIFRPVFLFSDRCQRQSGTGPGPCSIPAKLLAYITMIDISDFIKSVEDKKKDIQKFYERGCRVLNMLLPCRFKARNKPVRDYTFATICKKNGLDMVAASLYSLYRNSDYIPSRVVIISDGSWEPEFGVSYFCKRGLDVECMMWQTCAEYYKESLPELHIWATRHIWGKKMAAILFLSENNAVLFSDPDVLWYGTPLREDEWSSLPFKISIDSMHSYDQDFIRQSGSGYLNDTPDPINCGVVYIKGGKSLLNEQAINCIRYQAEHCGNFAEQTVFAIMDLRFGNRWSREEVVSTVEDVIRPFFSRPVLFKNTIARHYLWRLKWIYWTEYFKMRITRV